MASSKNMKLLEPNEWAKRTARRLRVSHHSFADQTFEEKREFLEDELDFALGDLGTESGPLREKYLDALIELFPVFGQVVTQGEGAGSEKTPKAKTAIEKVLEGWGEASEDERKLVAAQLGLCAKAEISVGGAVLDGAAIPEGVAMPTEAQGVADLKRTMEQVSRVFQISEGEEISFARLFKLAGMLVDNFDGLHSFVWKFWDFICPRDAEGELEPEINGGLKTAFHSYLTSEEYNSAKIYKEVDTTKLLLLAVCSSINQCGEEFGRQFGNRYSPDQIESAVVIEDTGGDPSKVKDLERKSWLKYRQLSKNLTPGGVDDELKVLIGQLIAAWMRRNRKRSNQA